MRDDASRKKERDRPLGRQVKADARLPWAAGPATVPEGGASRYWGHFRRSPAPANRKDVRRRARKGGGSIIAGALK
jgi:hypothetical protein